MCFPPVFFRQKDIGLERFDTTNLFVKLLTPTFFVIITVVQLYYFHKDFLAISDIKSRYVGIEVTYTLCWFLAMLFIMSDGEEMMLNTKCEKTKHTK